MRQAGLSRVRLRAERFPTPRRVRPRAARCPAHTRPSPAQRRKLRAADRPPPGSPSCGTIPRTVAETSAARRTEVCPRALDCYFLFSDLTPPAFLAKHRSINAGVRPQEDSWDGNHLLLYLTSGTGGGGSALHCE